MEVLLFSADWTDVKIFDPNDVSFNANERKTNPTAGFGVGWYGDNFFTGFSIPSFFTYDEYENTSSVFDLSKSVYLVTGGYLFTFSPHWRLQPSLMMSFKPGRQNYLDVNSTLIYNDLLWVGLSYRTTQEIVAMVGYQVNPQLRFAYSFDYTTGEIGNYNNGTHEISIQYAFGYRIKTPNPKFF